MRFALVDDAAAERETAGRLFSSFAEEMHTEFEVDMFGSGEAFLAAFVPYTYDIVFMDIYMGGMSGIDTARKMRESDSRSLLIFLTSSDEHMGQAFSVHAFDYMEKPLDRNKFFTCLTDSLALLPKPEDYLSFSSNGLDIRLFYSEIACLSSCGHSTVVQCTSGREYTVYSAFSVFTKPLTDDERFLLVSRRILVNMDHIGGISALVGLHDLHAHGAVQRNNSDITVLLHMEMSVHVDLADNDTVDLFLRNLPQKLILLLVVCVDQCPHTFSCHVIIWFPKFIL